MKNVLALMAAAWMPALLIAQSCEELPTDSIFACYGDTVLVALPSDSMTWVVGDTELLEPLELNSDAVVQLQGGVIRSISNVTALKFEGTYEVNGDYVVLLNDAVANQWMANEYSFSFWFKSEGVNFNSNSPAYPRLITRDRSEYFFIGVNQNTTFPQNFLLNFQNWDGGSDVVIEGAVTGDWQFVAASVSGNVATVWLDGSELGSFPVTYNPNINRPLGIANNMEESADPSVSPFDGWMDEVYLWDEALTAAQHESMRACGFSEELPSPFAAWKMDEGSEGQILDEMGTYDATISGAEWDTDVPSPFCFECQATQQVVVEFSLESEVGCTDIEACNYEDDNVCEDGSCTYPSEDYLDCAGECLNDVNANGVCDELDVYGCDVLGACNYDASVTVYDGSCFYATAVYDCQGNCQSDADEDGICDQNEGASVGNGPDFCGDNTIWDPVAQRCIANGPVLCGENTVWDPISQACVGAQTCPTDLDGSGLIGLGDLLDLLSTYGTICD